MHAIQVNSKNVRFKTNEAAYRINVFSRALPGS